jgi:hypothetical protein
VFCDLRDGEKYLGNYTGEGGTLWCEVCCHDSFHASSGGGKIFYPWGDFADEISLDINYESAYIVVENVLLQNDAGLGNSV